MITGLIARPYASADWRGATDVCPAPYDVVHGTSELHANSSTCQIMQSDMEILVRIEGYRVLRDCLIAYDAVAPAHSGVKLCSVGHQNINTAPSS